MQALKRAGCRAGGGAVVVFFGHVEGGVAKDVTDDAGMLGGVFGDAGRGDGAERVRPQRDAELALRDVGQIGLETASCQGASIPADPEGVVIASGKQYLAVMIDVDAEPSGDAPVNGDGAGLAILHVGCREVQQIALRVRLQMLRRG